MWTLTLIILGLVLLTDDQRRTAANRIREALRLADLGIRKAALHMELDPSDFERALSGERKLDLWRLEMLPDAFHQHFHLLGLRDRGLPDTAMAALKIAPALLDLKRGA